MNSWPRRAKTYFNFGSFVMAPWVGRLRDARLDYGGSEHRFTANAGPHALHGLVTERPWQVTGDGELSIDLDDPWPWPCRVVHGHRRFAIIQRRRPCSWDRTPA
jgi:galactose mutarotase-like enzyme